MHQFRHNWLRLSLCLLLCVSLCACGRGAQNDAQNDAQSSAAPQTATASPTPVPTPPPTPEPYPPALLLVNAEHAWEGEAVIEIVPMESRTGCIVSEGIQGQPVAVNALYALFQAAHDDGIGDMCVTEGYRTRKQQEQIFDSTVRYHKKKSSMSSAEATSYTQTLVAKPGYSEHHTGLAFDISAPDSDSFASTEQCKWMRAHAYAFGFIERYTKQTQPDTNTQPEPWHWRYVGAKAAAAIHESGESLESYLQRTP